MRYPGLEGSSIVANFKDFDEADSGKKALSLFKNKNYDLILLDCQMPEMNGFEVAQKIREMETAENEPTIIAVTADAMKGAEQKCMASGMDDYISKPVDKEKLQQIMTCWIPGETSTETQKENITKNTKSDCQIFNWDHLHEFTDGSEAAEKKILGIFIDNLEQDIKKLESSFETKNYEDWDEMAHKLYGACAHIGAYAMAKICDQAQMLSANDTDNIIKLHHAIIGQYQLLHDTLESKKLSA